SIPPRKMEILRSIKYFEKILPSLNVNIQYNTKPDSDTLNQYDEVIVAIGASNFMLPLSGNTDYVVSSWDVLEGKVEVKGKVAVIGGGLVGTETAEYLAEKGCEVSIIEMTDKIAAQESGTILPLIQEDFKKYNVKEYVNTKVCGLSEDGKTIYANNPDPVEIQADAIVMAVGSKKLLFDETGINVPVHYVGDCSNKQTADIASAIRSAYHCANEI
ncbi:MAG: FAD-dependent oxidoreductase, partial [Floccifex porci]